MRNITVGIDIGSSQVKVVAAELVKQNGKHEVRILGTGLAESKGLRHGYIVSGPEVTEAVKAAVTQAEKTAGVKINRAYVAVGGTGLSAFTSTGSIIISRADGEISELELVTVAEEAEKSVPKALIQNRRVLHPIPLSYKIDGREVLAKTPLGMRGEKLEVKMLFVTCLDPHLNDLLEAVEEAGVEVIDVSAAPIAASFVTLSKQQKMAGVVLANIGAETLSIAVFENNLPQSLEVFPIGSTDITNDIALGLKIPLEDAENIKRGALGPHGTPKKKLDDIVTARLGDMFELIESHLKKIGRNGLLPAGIIISGGGSGLGSVEDLAKAALKLPSRLAEINSATDKTKVKDSTWAVAYGLCMLGFSSEEKSSLGVGTKAKTSGKKLFGWLKQFLP